MEHAVACSVNGTVSAAARAAFACVALALANGAEPVGEWRPCETTAFVTAPTRPFSRQAREAAELLLAQFEDDAFVRRACAPSDDNSVIKISAVALMVLLMYASSRRTPAAPSAPPPAGVSRRELLMREYHLRPKLKHKAACALGCCC